MANNKKIVLPTLAINSCISLVETKERSKSNTSTNQTLESNLKSQSNKVGKSPTSMGSNLITEEISDTNVNIIMNVVAEKVVYYYEGKTNVCQDTYEVSLNQIYPNFIMLKNRAGRIIEQNIHFKYWKFYAM